VVQGRIFDVAVDIRRISPSFGKVYTFELRSGHGIWVPAGYAHGFQTLEDALLVYLVSEEFVPVLYRCIRWDDTDLAVRWPISEVVVSEKDTGCPKFRDAKHL
jgi:dTDP-4-dehydrorhamnose 3,5-epimerase